MSKFSRFQRLTALVLAMTLGAPLSAFAETRRLSQTEIASIASQVIQAILIARQQQPQQQREPQQRPPTRQPREDRSEPAPTTSRRPSSGVEQSTTVSRRAVLDAMNREREARGLGPLRLDSRLNAAADDRMKDMFDKGYFDHVSPDGTQPFVWVKYRNYQYATVGENLAEGYRSAAGVVDGWMNSPGHRRNLLGESFEDCGVAIVRGSPSGRTNGYTAVALYAREAKRRPTSVTARR